MVISREYSEDYYYTWREETDVENEEESEDSGNDISSAGGT